MWRIMHLVFAMEVVAAHRHQTKRAGRCTAFSLEIYKEPKARGKAHDLVRAAVLEVLLHALCFWWLTPLADPIGAPISR